MMGNRLGSLLRRLAARPDPVAQSPAAAPAPQAAAPALDINQLLHDSRGAFLRDMPAGAERMLSAGCAGAWYFEWVDRCYGRVAEHIGIEYYVEAPPVLPPHVRWIRNTVGDMEGVASASCDLVFSGENLEHLWPADVAGFLLEAARVLRPGGHLVMDSPNRDLTAPLLWSHPEHTIEVTPTEVTELLRLAGFAVTTMKGIYLCRDPRSGRVLPFDPNRPDPDFSLTERLVGAVAHPEHSLIWWAEARRGEAPPDADGVRALASALFRDHWPERIQRLIVPPPLHAENGWVAVPAAHDGVVFFGPYMPLPEGAYRCSWALRDGEEDGFASCDVMAGDRVLATVRAAPGATRLAIEFTLPELTWGLQFRCIAHGRGRFAARRAVTVELRDPTGAYRPTTDMAVAAA
jgi:SAM-dependent methyltransferase